MIYQTKGLLDDNSKGMIIYKKKDTNILSVETYKETYYESVLCWFQQGYICFLYLDEDIMAFKVSRLINKIIIH